MQEGVCDETLNHFIEYYISKNVLRVKNYLNLSGLMNQDFYKLNLFITYLYFTLVY